MLELGVCSIQQTYTNVPSDTAAGLVRSRDVSAVTPKPSVPKSRFP